MNTQSTLVGLFKETYGENIVEAWGFMAKLAKRINFLQQELRPGNFYHQPVDVQFEHGISEAGAGSVPGTTAPGPYFFNPTAGQMQDAQIAGAQLIGRSQVSYEAIARSANSKAAFKQATQHIVRRLSQAIVKRLEIHLLHGQRGIGTVSAWAAETNVGSTYQSVATITDASWSTGCWAGMVGALIDVYRSDLTSIQTANQNTQSIVCKVTAIDTVAKTVKLDYPVARVGWVANDVLFFAGGKGGTASTELAGLDVITRLNASSSAFQNIDPAVYDLWRGNQYSTSTGVLSFAKLLEAAGLAASYGLMDELVAVISPKAFEVLNSDIAALRQYDVSYKPAQGENGTSGLRFHAQTGIVEVMPHAFQKDGLAHLFAPNESLRVGATDVSFITRQGSEDKLILESSTTAASEMRAYSNQSLFCAQPRHTVLMDGITY